MVKATLCRVVVTACVVILPIGAVDAQTPASPSAGTAALRPGLAARGESLAAFDERCIPSGGVAPPSNTPGILGRRALPAGRLARLGATPDFHHRLLGQAAAGNAQAGKDLYLRYSCYACHGYAGHGGAGARLVPMRMTLASFTAYVRNPRQMPPYSTQALTDAQLEDVWAYIQTLPKSPLPKDIPLLMMMLNEK
ncbi:MAG: hypothetical protein DMF94_32835 [Acidobacteria bacterium]|nr:MAG: hypothetical protein DMF94_32835 [Acidobacteriota bacterium]